jgi:hypothetical protein
MWFQAKVITIKPPRCNNKNIFFYDLPKTTFFTFKYFKFTTFNICAMCTIIKMVYESATVKFHVLSLKRKLTFIIKCRSALEFMLTTTISCLLVCPFYIIGLYFTLTCKILYVIILSLGCYSLKLNTAIHGWELKGHYICKENVNMFP